MLTLREKNGNLGCNLKMERAVIAYYCPCSVDLDCVLHFCLNYVR